MVDEELIENYFYLNKRITKTRLRMAQRKQTYNQSNYYPSTFIEDEAMRKLTFRIEPEVINYVSAQQDAEKHITIMKFKLKHFNRFLKSIPRESRRYYFYKYKEHAPRLNDRLDHLLHDEIAEIEEAVCHYFKIALPVQIEIDNTSMENHFETMMNLLEV